MKAFPGQEGKATEEELLEQFISALDSRELRLSVSQTSPGTLDTALQAALKLETLFMVENNKCVTKEINMASNEINMASPVNSMLITGTITAKQKVRQKVPGLYAVCR